MTQIFSAWQLSWALWSWTIKFCGHLPPEAGKTPVTLRLSFQGLSSFHSEAKNNQDSPLCTMQNTAAGFAATVGKSERNRSSFALLRVKYILLPQQLEKKIIKPFYLEYHGFLYHFCHFQLVAMIVQRVNADTGRASKLLGGFVCSDSLGMWHQKSIEQDFKETNGWLGHLSYAIILKLYYFMTLYVM